MQSLRAEIETWARELGFQGCGVSDVDLGVHAERLHQWLENKYHGDMDYMASHGPKRSQPEALVPGTIKIISVRMDYNPGEAQAQQTLNEPERAYIARYALGRDYHKLMRKRLARLAGKIKQRINDLGEYRAFVDSAPVLERAIAEKAGLGWIGKNTMLLNKHAGSWFFLGELFTNLPLPSDSNPSGMHCGSCTACLEICPTNAFVKPFVLDARKCISYLTIESQASIPLELREAMGNRVFGCDDCQLVCPWNKFAQSSEEPDFSARHNLDHSQLVDLFNWSETEFLQYTAGSAIRRVGYQGWLRNLAVGLGNAPYRPTIVEALRKRLDDDSAIVREHVEWALQQQCHKRKNQ